EAAKKDPRPSLIACRTIIGYGAPKKAGTKDSHGAALGAEEVAAARVKLGWNYPAFEIPQAILDTWRGFSARGHKECEAWRKRHSASGKRAEFDAALETRIRDEAFAALQALKEKIAREKPKTATRQSSGFALEALLPQVPELIGGSADLTGS